MPASLDMIEDELRQLGFSTSRFNSPHGEVVSFSYAIDVGMLKGVGCQLGVSMQEQGFPVYAPHWIHLTPPIRDKKNSGRPYTDDQGREWVAFSRPPTYWDSLPERNMKVFLEEHIRRFLANDVCN